MFHRDATVFRIFTVYSHDFKGDNERVAGLNCLAGVHITATQ